MGAHNAHHESAGTRERRPVHPVPPAPTPTTHTPASAPAELGIRPNQARSTALFQLATEIPAAILARTPGIHTDVAVARQRLSAGDWATYAAEVSRRSSNRTSKPAETIE
ncbi:hypothetical protein OH809_24685 [Streptomyces sp. NBC_00873]|uniref:hypothetical protein n=1 Tax=unclassified Streptomyces TaxID=2593676 RepID=UPI0038645C09|nr:hypothetical protein OH809_24685 [Streptomyces sp. NBC_00873]WTA44386.1 hypothetical protein OH821_18605 [Streptomyces sp. NBC_00842]